MSFGAVEYEVMINDRRAVLTIENNTSIEAAAGDFCRLEGLDDRPECMYMLMEALMTKRKRRMQGTPPSAAVGDGLEGSFANMRSSSLKELHAGRGVLLFVHLKKCGGMTLQQEVIEPAYQGWPRGTIAHAPEEMRWFFNEGDEVSVIPCRQKWDFIDIYHLTLSLLQQAMLRWTRALSLAKVVADHIPFGFHSLIAPRLFVYVTVLREPRSRILSYYKYLRVATDWEYPCMIADDHDGGGGGLIPTMCKNNWWPAGLPRNASISEWLERQLTDGHYVRAHIDNYQVSPSAVSQSVSHECKQRLKTH